MPKILANLKKASQNPLSKWLVLVISFFIYLPWFFDTDLWWHLRLGQEISKGNFLINTLTYTCTDFKWVNYGWLSDLLMYLGYSRIGYIVLAIATALIFLSGVYISYRTLLYWLKNHSIKAEQYEGLSKSIFVFIGFIIFNAGFLLFFIYARPQIFSFLFFAILLNRLIKGYYEGFNIKDYLIVSLVIVLWANMHGSFTIGLLFVGLFIGIFILSIALHVLSKIKIDLIKQDLQRLKNFGVLIPLFIFLPLINPYGISLWREVISQVLSGQNSQYITEWSAIDFHTQEGLIYLGIVIVACIFILLNRRANLLRHSLFLLAVLLGFYAIKFQLVTDIIIAIVLFFEVLVFFENLNLDKSNKELIALGGRALILACFVVGIILIPFNLANLIKASQDPIKNAEYPGMPYNAMQYIKTHPDLAALNYYNDYAWGGYLEFAYSEKSWFIDGRMSNWSCSSRQNSTILLDYIAVLRLRPDWMEVFNTYKINGLLIPKGTPIANVIKYMPQWKEEYKDDDVVIYKRIN